ncbi:MAG: hypothetical protein QOE25_276, partial [Actinomycetota bacterium]|nr:hypothetical protein [Actinomycetota bacterium]
MSRRALAGTASFVILLALVAPIPAALADGGCGSDLSAMGIPVTVKSVDGLAAVSTTDVWGLGTSLGNPSTAAAIHWDGSAWSSAPVPSLPGEAEFNAAAAVSSTEVWGVGSLLANGRYMPLSEHWDGSSWQADALPKLPGQNASLVDVTATPSGDLWSVGFAASGAKRLPVALHRDGGAWASVAVPNGGSKSNALLGVAAASGHSVWAVGYASKGSGFRTLVEHWDGASWSVVSARNPGRIENVFTDVAVGPDGLVWAIGYQVTGVITSPLIERWNGVAWKSIATPETGSPVSLLRDIAFSADGTAWAVGTTQDPVSGTDLPLSMHLGGGVWALAPTPAGTGGDTSFGSVAFVPGTAEVWAGGRAAFVGHACGGSPSVSPPASPYAPVVGAAGPPHLVPAGADLITPLPQHAALAVTSQDVAAPAGIAETTKTFGAAVGDANGDGAPDIVLGRQQTPAHRYVNQGGTFTEPNPSLFPAKDRHRCAFLD